MEHLNQEIAALENRVKEAEASWLSAEPVQKADLKEVWLRLCKLTEVLEEQRVVLSDKLASQGNI